VIQNFHTILLAAGASRRMGNRNKLLLHQDGIPWVRRVAISLVEAGLEPIHVVTGFEAKAIERALTRLPVAPAYHANWEQGMGSSLAFGVSLAPPLTDGFLVCLADLPFLLSSDIRAVLERFRETGGTRVCVPIFNKQRGHPVAFPPEFGDRLRSLSGDTGAGEWIRPEERVWVTQVSAGVVRDLDCLDDLTPS